MTKASALSPQPSATIETITLDRTGLPPLKFEGTLLTTASGQFVQPPKDKPNADYFTLSIYRAHGVHGPSPTWIVQIVYRKELRGHTTDHHFAVATDDPAATLGEYNPLAVVVGFPPNDEFAERQRALETKMRRQYDLLVSAVLKTFPEEIGDVEDGYRRGADISRYRTLLELGKQEFGFTEAEASLICDALNGTMMDNQSWQFIESEIKDGCRLNNLHTKWQVHDAGILVKLKRLSPLARHALIDAVERFWRNPNQDTHRALVTVGLIEETNRA